MPPSWHLSCLGNCVSSFFGGLRAGLVIARNSDLIAVFVADDDEITCDAFVNKISEIDARFGSRRDRLLTILRDLIPRARADNKV